MIADLKEKRHEYMKGEVPMEDSELKKIIALNSKFVEKVQKTIKYSGGKVEKSRKIGDVIIKEELNCMILSF